MSIDNELLLCDNTVPSIKLGADVDKSLIRELVQRSANESLPIKTIASIIGCSQRTVYRYLKPNYQASTTKQVRPKRRIAPEIERAILKLTQKHPNMGRRSLARLANKKGIQISVSGVYIIWQRNKITRGDNHGSPR